MLEIYHTQSDKPFTTLDKDLDESLALLQEVYPNTTVVSYRELRNKYKSKRHISEYMELDVRRILDDTF